MPFLCLVFNKCAFGLDRWLFFTHIARLASSFAYTVYAHKWSIAKANVTVRMGARIVWFTGFKALFNTVLVVSGLKRPPRFKLTRKAGAAQPPEDTKLPDGISDGSDEASPHAPTSKGEARGSPNATDAAKLAPRERTYALHAAAARVTEQRRRVMPLNGTLDVWVLATMTGINLAAVVFGLVRLQRKGAFKRFGAGGENVLWLQVAFAFVDASPGLVFAGYMAFRENHPRLLKWWCPTVIIVSIIAAILFEARLLVGFVAGV